MAFNNLADCRQANARALIVATPVQALEDCENLIDILHIEANADRIVVPKNWQDGDKAVLKD